MSGIKIPLLETPVPGRVCWLCTHVRFFNAWPGTDVTPDNEFDLACSRNFWQFNPRKDGLEDFRLKLESAERCAAFEARTP